MGGVRCWSGRRARGTGTVGVEGAHIARPSPRPSPADETQVRAPNPPPKAVQRPVRTCETAQNEMRACFGLNISDSE